MLDEPIGHRGYAARFRVCRCGTPAGVPYSVDENDLRSMTHPPTYGCRGRRHLPRNARRASSRLSPMTGNVVRDAYAGRAEEYTALLGSMANTHESDQRLVAQWARDLRGAVLDIGPIFSESVVSMRRVSITFKLSSGKQEKNFRRSRSESLHWAISGSETNTQLRFLRGTPLFTLPRMTCQRFCASSSAALLLEAASSSVSSRATPSSRFHTPSQPPTSGLSVR